MQWAADSTANGVIRVPTEAKIYLQNLSDLPTWIRIKYSCFQENKEVFSGFTQEGVCSFRGETKFR
jgi:hypothetical protein